MSSTWFMFAMQEASIFGMQIWGMTPLKGNWIEIGNSESNMK